MSNIADITRINMFDKDNLSLGVLSKTIGSTYGIDVLESVGSFYSKLVPVKLNEEVWFYSNPIGTYDTEIYQYDKDFKLVKNHYQYNGKFTVILSNVKYIAAVWKKAYIDTIMLSYTPLNRYYSYSEVELDDRYNIFDPPNTIDGYTPNSNYMYPYIEKSDMLVSYPLPLKDMNLSYVNDSTESINITLFNNNPKPLVERVITIEPGTNGTIECSAYKYYIYTMKKGSNYKITIVNGNIIPLPRYEKQDWIAYDESKPETLQPDAILSADRLNHIEQGLYNADKYSHLSHDELSVIAKEAVKKVEEQTKLVNSAMVDINEALNATSGFTAELDDARTDSDGNKQANLGDSIRGQIKTRGNVLEYNTNKLQLKSGSNILSEIEFTATSIGALPSTTKIPSKNSELQNDSNFTTLEAVKSYIAESGGTGGGGNTLDYLNNKLQLRSGSNILSEIEFTAATIGALSNTVKIPSKNSELQNDSNFTTLEAVKAYIAESGGTGGGSGGSPVEETSAIELQYGQWSITTNRIKTYGNVVEVKFEGYSKSSGLPASGEIGTIPEKYRPKQKCSFVGLLFAADQVTVQYTTFMIRSNGVISFYGKLSNQRYADFAFTYII